MAFIFLWYQFYAKVDLFLKEQFVNKQFFFLGSLQLTIMQTADDVQVLITSSNRVSVKKKKEESLKPLKKVFV